MITELSSSLTVTGVIATLISVIFAGASFAISHRRKTHHHPGAHSPHVPVPPPPAQPAAAENNHPGLNAFTSRPATNMETQIVSPPLFKMLGKTGNEKSVADAPETTDQLLWE